MCKRFYIFVILVFIGLSLFANAEFGNCLEFDGIDDYVSIPANTDLNNPNFTVEFWIQLDNPNNWTGIIDKGRDSETDWYFLTGNTGYTEGVRFGVGSGSSRQETAYSWNDTDWHHVAGTYDGFNMNLYVDGDLKSTNTASMSNTTNNITFGARRGQSWFTNGKLDEIRIWESVRTQAEISDHRYLELNGNETNLVGYWKLNSSSGTTSFDAANGHDGTLNNMSNDDWIGSEVPLGNVFNGTISSNTVWDKYMQIDGDVTINDNVTLTVEPGVRIHFNGYYKFDVQGTVIAEGTETDSIKFTAHPDVPWNRIFFDNTSTANDSSKFVHCLIENSDGVNYLSNYNGGAFTIINYDKIHLEHCVLQNNIAQTSGAIYLYNSSIKIKNCIIQNNEATEYYAGAIGARENSTPLISNCIIKDNIANGGGGAVYLNNTGIANLKNCLIVNNQSDAGGAIYIAASSPNIINCTIVENYATEAGGAFNVISYSPEPEPVFRNCIIYENEAGSSGDQVYLSLSANPDFYNCNLEGGSSAFGGTAFSGTYQDCIDLDPLFEDPDNDDYSLSLLSPCINGGDPNTTNIQAGNYDLAGNPRFYDNILCQGSLNDALDRIDIGAYERQLTADIKGILPNEFVINGYNFTNIDLHICKGFNVNVGPGTELRFHPDHGFDIEGNLIASGEADSMITIRPHSFSTGFKGLNFTKDQYDPVEYSSTLEYCRIQGGFAPAYPDNSGGNIYSQIYDEINLINCIIEKGEADISGGGIYAWQSDVNLINCVLNENQSDWEGGAGWFQLSQVNMINSTFADNTADSSVGGVKFDLGGVAQPQIVNCIFWNNGDEPLLPDDGSLTDVTYCNIETGFSGTGNISVDPNFTGETNHPYNIKKSSFCLNAGKQDTTGLNLPQYDLLGNERIYAHTNSAYDRPDIGAYESQGILAPGNFTASDGNNNYPGYVQLFWDYSDDYEPAPSNFRIYRDDININTLDGNADSYSDYNVVPGQIYSYYVQAVVGNETRNSDENSGYIKPNGIITGTVLSANNNPVQDVKVSLDLSPGYCLELDSSSSSSLTISNPEVNMDYNFTIEFWIKTSMNDVVLLQKGSHYFAITSDNKVKYSDGTNTLIQQVDSLFANDGEWHHLAVVNEHSNSSVKLYLDENLVAEDASFTFSGSSDSDFSTAQDFTGFLDDIKIWASIRDSSQIAGGMYVVEAWDEPGLAGYWPFNEGNGNAVFDATNYAHNGSISNCSWSTNEPGIMLGDYTDANGEYSITQIYYGASTTFTVTPFKTGHFFQPEQRQITLNTSNTAQDNVDFTDNSLIPISGYVTFQGTQCAVEMAEILLNGASSAPPTFTDEDGYFVMEVEHGTECSLSASYYDHTFNREWHLGEVTFPQTNINFENTFKTGFRCEVVGGDDHFPIGEFDVSIQSVNGCYSKVIEEGSWTTGGININNLPPMDFNVTVDPDPDNDPFVLELDDQFQSMKTQMISLTNPDSLLDTLRYVWKNDLQVSVSWPDTLELYHFTEYPESEFYVLPQNKWCEVEIKAFENYSWTGFPNQITYLDNCELVITDEIGTKGETEAVFQDTTVYTYSFAPYIPNMLSGYNRQYQNMLEVRAVDNELERMAIQTDWVLIEGVKPTETTYSSTSPEIPFLILHDPPGDASYASFSTSSSHTTSLQASVSTNQSAGTNMTVHMGPDITYAAGTPFFSSEHEVDITNDYSLGLSVNLNQSVSMEQSLTLTTSESYSTSADDQIIGDGADVFVGGAINLIWGLTHELSWDELEENVVIDTSLMVTPDGFATVYVYTENQIETTVIPNLYAIGDSSSAELWQNYLDNNENNKSNAVTNSNHPGNVSFNAGAGYTFEEQNTSVEAQTIEFTTTVSTEFGYHIGTVVDGIGTINGYEFSASLTVGVASSSNYQSSTTTSFTLADDDETSTLNFLPDYFTIDIKKDPVYGTPVFELLSGASSCHWEPNTQPRDGVSLSANTYTASNLQTGEEAAFLLQLGNTTQTNEYRSYNLSIRQNTNPNGAIVKINGVLLEGAMSFSVPPGETVQAIMTVAQGPFDYEYENLEILYYAPGDIGYLGPEGHDFWVTKSFDIYWEAPYSRVSIHSPADNWIINQANNDTMNIIFTDYDLTKEDFRSLKLQYKHPQDQNWLPGFEIFRDSLLSHPHYIEIPWDVSSIADGLYEIRAATTDSVQSDYYADALTGTIDRQSPELLGEPEPADDILNPGDEISISFAELLDVTSVDHTNITLKILSSGEEIAFDEDCFENKITIIPAIANYWFENETLEAEVSGVKDLYGNETDETINWEFYVNANPVYWNVTKLDVVKPLGESMTLTTDLINSGGLYYSYVFTDFSDSLYHPELEYHAPDWLTISPSSGQLIPLDAQEISFEISEQIGFGHYETTIYAHTSMGNEAIVIEVDVLSNPPDWSISEFNNFQSSMSIIGELNIEEEISSDTDDIIGAFIEDENGNYLCRGVANLELVPYIPEHSYQVFLTVYSNEDDSVGSNNQVKFRIWDSSDNKEFYGIDHSVFGDTLTFAANDVYGSPLNPINLQTTGNLVQDIDCNSGWTWISTNLILTSPDVNDVLAPLNPADNDLIKNQQQFAQFSGNQWVGSLTSMNNTSMYKLNLAESQDLEIVGNLRDPLNTPINYNSGWNWIGYIPHVKMSVNEALSNRTNQSGDFIKNQNGYTFYVDDDIGWIGSLVFMDAGEGFMLQSAQAGQFIYPAYVSKEYENYLEYKPIVLRDPPDWSINPQEYEYTANLTIELQINDNPASTGDYMIGAFAGDECRGAATPIDVSGAWLYFLTVYGNSQNEEIDLMLYSQASDEVLDPDTSFVFFNDLILGSPSSPFNLHIIDELAKPQNIELAIIIDQLEISWDEVEGAASYKIYAADDPQGTFTDITNQGTFGTKKIVGTTLTSKTSDDRNKALTKSRFTWITNIEGIDKKFYYILATIGKKKADFQREN